MKIRRIILKSILYIYTFFVCTKTFYVRPGLGFSTITGDISEGICYEPNNIYVSHYGSIVEMNTSYSDKDLYNEMGIQVHAEGSFDIYSSEATVSYVKSKAETSLSFTSHYLIKIYRDLSIDYPYEVTDALTEDGKRIYAYGKNRFRTFCGDKYLLSYQEGAMLIYSITYYFQTITEKENFKTELEAGVVGFGSVSTTFEQISQKTNIKGSMKIEARQVGGDPRELAKILSSNAQSCTFNDAEVCKITLAALLDYSKAFPNQIDIENEALGTMEPLGPYTVSEQPFFPEQIDLTGDDPITVQILKARENLIKIKEFIEMNIARLNDLEMQGYLPYAPGLMQNLTLSRLNLQILLNGLKNGPMSGCWYDFEYCLDIQEEIEKNLLPFTFDPKAVSLCNIPSEHGLNAADLCARTANFVGSASWSGGTYTNPDKRIPGDDGLCYGQGTAEFRKRKKFGPFRIGWNYFFASCGQVSYSPQPDPTPEPSFNWLLGWEWLIDYLKERQTEDDS